MLALRSRARGHLRGVCVPAAGSPSVRLPADPGARQRHRHMRLLLNCRAARQWARGAGAPGGPAATGFVLSAPGRPDRPVHWSARGADPRCGGTAAAGGARSHAVEPPRGGHPAAAAAPGGEEDDDLAEVAWADMWKTHRDGTMVLLRVRGETTATWRATGTSTTCTRSSGRSRRLSGARWTPCATSGDLVSLCICAVVVRECHKFIW